MPPKKSARRAKRKAVALPLVKPEAPDADEVEAAMLWDRIAPLGPNPMQPQGGIVHNYSAGAAIDAGPPPKEVLGMASATIPLVATAPVVPLVPQTSAAKSKDRERDNASSVASPRDAARAGADQGSPVAPSATFASTLLAAPRPPLRRAPATARALLRLAESEREASRFTDHLSELREEEARALRVVAYDREQFEEEHRALLSQIAALHEVQEAARTRHTEIGDKQQMHFDMLRFRLEEELAQLDDESGRVEANLAEKLSMLSKRSELQNEVTAMQLSHSENVKQNLKALEDHKNVVRHTMVSRLMQTTDEMKAITASQRQLRQQRAVTESKKLVSELTALEHRSKALNATNARLTLQSQVTARDRALEADRRQLLLKKNAALSADIKSLVSSLQELEKMYATKAAKLAPSHEVQALSDTVDRQYSVILRLKAEIDASAEDVSRCRERTDDSRRQQLLTGASGPTDKVALIPVLDSKSFVEAKHVAVETLLEIDQQLQRSHFPNGIADLTDPRQRLNVQNTVLRRVRLALSSCAPLARSKPF